jgi:glycine C-acetyltransferase
LPTRDPVGFLRTEYDSLVAQDLDWRIKALRGPSLPRANVGGKENVIVLCSNNYLGLSTHPKVKAAAARAARTHGGGSGSVRPIAGTMDLHEELEHTIAHFKHQEAALVYQSGFATNAGLIPQLVGEGDVVISDELNHGSIIDGVRLSRAERMVYAHNDVGELEKRLEEAEAKKYRRILIISDGVFSMDGDIAPVDQIVKVAEPHGAMIYIDDAHGEGVMGQGGRGIASHFKVEGKVQVEMGTFSKAFGVVGGYVAGTKDLRNFALNKSRTWLLSGSHPPAVAAACTAAVKVLESEPKWVDKLWKNTNYFRKQLVKLGFDTGKSVTPIIPVMTGESSKAKAMSEALFEQGVWALPIVYPMVAKDKARIRTINNAKLTRKDLNEALAAFEKAGRQAGVL